MTPGMRVKGNEAEILIGLLKSKMQQIKKRGVAEGSLVCVMGVGEEDLTEPGDEFRCSRPTSRELFSATWEYERDGS